MFKDTGCFHLSVFVNFNLFPLDCLRQMAFIGQHNQTLNVNYTTFPSCG